MSEEKAANLNVTVGALLIGVLITAVGYGITTMQTYMYTSRFPKDPRYLKTIVAVLFILDTAHVALSWHAIYHYLVLNYGDRVVLKDSVWSFNVTIILTTIITVIVHCFFARRVYILGGGSWFLTVTIVVLSIIRMVFGCYVSIEIFILKNLETLPFTLSPYVGTALSAGTLADFIVTGSLVYFLRKHKTGFRGTDSLVDRIVSWTVNNGFLTSLVGLTVIVTFSAMPNNMIFLAVHLFLSKLYANSLLGTLNFRKAHRGRGLYDDPTTVGTLRLSQLRMPGFSMPRFGRGETDTTLESQQATGPVIEIRMPGAHGHPRDARRSLGLKTDTGKGNVAPTATVTSATDTSARMSGSKSFSEKFTSSSDENVLTLGRGRDKDTF